MYVFIYLFVINLTAADSRYGELGPRRRDDAKSKIAHETTDALALSGHARTPSDCKSGDIKRTIIIYIVHSAVTLLFS
jgi:hypothetical protein